MDKEEYKNCRLRYKIDSANGHLDDLNKENYEKMKKALDAVGISFDVSDNELRLEIYPEEYVRVKDRNAGRQKKIIVKCDAEQHEFVRYADIICMMQKMTDKEISERIGMPIATYGRHKKKMKESKYYNSLDRNKLDDLEYLKSVKGNHIF